MDDELLEVMVQIGRQLSLVLERTRATEALQASEQRNRRIVETASDAFLAMDESGRVVEWNQQAELLFGWSREEALGREAAELIVAEELGEAHPEGLHGYLSTGSGPVVSNRMNLEAKHRDGARFPVELAVWEITTPSGRELNAFVRDISRQKETEEALASARDQAIEASRLKSEFLANMSHEIRTPMNGVIGLANLLLDTDLDGPQRRYAEGIQSAGEALLGLINDILDLSKAEAGKIELEQVDFDLQELVEEATTLLAGPAAEKGLELVGYTDPSLPRAVRGDPGRVRQVLVNLVGNAVKFTERGEVVVRALGERLDDRAVLARFEVRDTGIGIDAPVQARLFQPFTQADASTTRRYGGTGLGLALSKRLVELMGGAIGVQSEPRAGSTFWFTVPFETRAEPPTERALPQAPPSVGTVRALVVDDNATNRLILEQQLCSWGLRVDSEEDPRRALELARAAAATGEPYGVALLDLQMPEMSGLELAEAMGRELGLGQPAVILLSSVGAVSSADRTLNGVRLSLMKPIRQSELFNSLAQVLGRGTEPAIDGDDRAREEAERTSGGHGAVLVVEDNSINRTVALGTLAKLGYQADVAVNGREAVEAVRRRAYSAVLMDCQMPEMDGYEATREIREREDGVRHVPIIAMTAAAMAGDRERCLQAGMDDYIAKPLRLEDVDAALRRWTSETLPPGERVPPPPRQDGEAVLDCSHLEELRSLGAQTGNADMFEELVGALVQELPARLSEVQAAARREDLDALGRIAHRVTGSLATLGARRAASASAALEAAARGTDAAAVAERLHDFEVELDTAVKALERAAAREHRPDG